MKTSKGKKTNKSSNKNTHKRPHNSKGNLAKGTNPEKNEETNKSFASDRKLGNKIPEVLSKPGFAREGEDEQLSRRAVDLVSDVLRSIESEKDDGNGSDDLHTCGATNGVRSLHLSDFSHCSANNTKEASPFVAEKTKSAYDKIRNHSKATSTPASTAALPVEDREPASFPDKKKETALAAAISQAVANAITEAEEEYPNDDHKATHLLWQQKRKNDNTPPSSDTEKIMKESLTMNGNEDLKSCTSRQIILDKSIGVSEVDIEVIRGFLLMIEELAISVSERNASSSKAGGKLELAMSTSGKNA